TVSPFTLPPVRIYVLPRGNGTKPVGSRLALLLTPIEDQPDLGQLLATGQLPQELLEPSPKLLDRGGSPALRQGVEQIVGLDGNGDQPGQCRLHSLDQFGADLVGKPLRLQEPLDGRLLVGR